jgi:ACR3 family arsenite efflux pump ArsB
MITADVFPPWVELVIMLMLAPYLLCVRIEELPNRVARAAVCLGMAMLVVWAATVAGVWIAARIFPP